MSNEKSNNQQDEGEDSYYEEDPSNSKRQKTQNDQSDETPLTLHEQQEVKNNKIEWKDNLYSSFSVFGAQNKSHIKHQ